MSFYLFSNTEDNDKVEVKRREAQTVEGEMGWGEEGFRKITRQN